MNGTQHTKRPTNVPVKWPLLCGLMSFVLVCMAPGQMSLYDNENVFLCPPASIPTIDATNFLNNSSFTIDFTNQFASPGHLQIFETRDTLNYTNNGLITGNNGFQFDTYTLSSGLHSMASTFNNGGTIRSGSAIDGVTSIDGFPPELIVLATNIVNSGTVIVGQNNVTYGTFNDGFVTDANLSNGLLLFTGQNIDLTRSILSVEGLINNVNSGSGGVSGSGGFGTDTNQDWVPSIDLAPTFALSSLSVPIAAIFPPNNAQLFLTNSTPYFTVQGAGTSNVVLRMVFVENYNPIPYNVYIGPVVVGTGESTIEWVGSYLDSATGNTLNNYLYLNDDYLEGSQTNVGINTDGVPDNFTIVESPTQIPIGSPQATAFPTGLIQPFGAVVTNTYSYGNAQLIDTSVPTNSTPTNPSGALTNLPGRIQINASRELNLSLANISGLNYMSLTSSNQFDGSTGAQIFSPYSDINIGVTNGFLNISNLTEATIPIWSGTIQCWSGRWVFVDATGVTNDYRVLIVGSQLVPTTSSQAQNLTLHGTNSVVISDAFNIIRKFSIDAQNLTLTTNAVGGGAESLDGELNVENPALFWQNCVPNLRNLTNNGAIRLQNLAVFGNPQTNYYNFINTGTVVDQGAQIWANNFISSGIFSNGVGSFTLQSTNTVLTNGLLTANADISIATSSLIASNLVLQAGRSLKLTATNLLTDTGPTSSNFWTVGAVAINNGTGLSLPIKPLVGDLLGTTITNIAPTNKNVFVTWSGKDFGASSAGFTNNEALGRLIVDSFGTYPQNGLFTFNGAGVSNAIYVDYLEFRDSATNEMSYDFSYASHGALSINTNITIYFAQAMLNGVSIAEKIDIASRFNGKNGGRLLWVPTYAGHFSSTNLVSGGVTNTFNAALAASPDIDSDGDGMGNAGDTTPFFLASQLNFTETLTNVPPPFGSIVLSWNTIPNATNYVYYTTNMMSTNWFLLLQTNSPQPYPSPPSGITVLDPVNPVQPRFYKVVVQPWLTYPY